jgi:hypothetical protein
MECGLSFSKVPRPALPLRRRLVRVSHRVVFGALEAVEQVLSACGGQINTAFVERLNLDIRQHVAAVGRRVNTLCKGEDGVRQQLALYQTYHNFAQFIAVCRRPKWSKDLTNSPLLALLAMVGSNAAHKINSLCSKAF